jgi:thiazole/oxazole-forming peptide maturase SagD family component
VKPKQKLRLDASAFVAPDHDRWLVRGASDFVSTSFQHHAALPDRLLELLDGTRDLQELARSAGIDAREMRTIVHRLRRRHLVASDRSVGGRSPQRWQWEAIQASARDLAGRARPKVLLVGLGALGLAVLRNLLALDLGTVFICDPAPVGGADIPGYFDDGDRGRLRQAAALDHLPPSLRSRASAIPIDTSDTDSIGASIEAIIGKVTAVVACSDCASALASEAGRICRQRNVPFVGAELTMSGAHIAPQRPDPATTVDDGCYSCEGLYRSLRDPFEWVLDQYAERVHPSVPPWRYPHDVAGLTTLSRVILLELLATLNAADGVRVSQPRHIFVDLESGNLMARALPRHYACSVCFPREVASVESLRQEARRRWTESREADGDPPSLTELWHRLQRFVDSDHGLFQSVQRTTGSDRQALASVFADRGVHARDGAMIQTHRVMAHRHVVRNGTLETVTTHGLTFDDARAAEALAILEGLERLFGLGYCDPRRVVTARYSDVESTALDPRRFPLYADYQYDDPAFKVRRFDPSASMDWLCGVRVVDDEPVLVPRELTFAPRSGLPIYRANSSGAACHSSLVRAILNGLYECIERDALMLAWFNRLSLPRLTMNSGRDPWQIRETFASLGFRITHVDLTNDLAIPVVLAVLEDEREKNFFMVTMATAPTREALLEKLYKELFHFSYPLLIHGDEYRTAVTRAQDPSRVVTMADHVCFYQSRRKIEHAAFLTSSTEERPFGALALPDDEPRAAETELRRLVNRLHQCGYDVVVVDCSAPALRQVGLHVVKVLVPGLQPLHGGHRYRVLGGRRVFEAARLMGYADRDRTPEELNPWPHPYW